MSNLPAYCAFLRGVNVSGRTMKMADVCEVFRDAGMPNVTSVLASGNVIFRSKYPQATLRTRLEQAMAKHYGEPVHLFIKNADEVETMIKSSPFKKNAELHIYVFVCEPGFEKTLKEEFAKIAPAPEEKAVVKSGVFYWQCAKGSTLDSGFSKILGRKEMKDKFTSRNINTIVKIAAKMHE